MHRRVRRKGEIDKASQNFIDSIMVQQKKAGIQNSKIEGLRGSDCFINELPNLHFLEFI